MMGKKECNCVSCHPEKKGEVGERTYTRAEVDAEIAAALEMAAKVCAADEAEASFKAAQEERSWEFDEGAAASAHVSRCIETQIRALATAPQRDALQALIAAAHEDGYRRGAACLGSSTPAAARDALSALLAAERERGREEVLVEPPWQDAPLPEDAEIRAAFPTRSGRHDLYAEAMRLVGARHSKGELVALVVWLLTRIASARQEGAEREREEIAGIVHDYHARCYGTAERAENATAVLEARIRARGGRQP